MYFNRSLGLIDVVFSLVSGWKFNKDPSIMSLSNTTFTATLSSFISAKGDTEPGITPKKFSNLSELPKDSRLPPNFCPNSFKSILRSSLQTTSHISFFFARKNKFLQCIPGKSPLNFLESSTVNNGGCS